MRVAVIGSGIVGASAACHLSRRAGVSVTIVDAGLPGQATAAGAGIVCPWVDHADDPDWYRLARAGALYNGELGFGHARVGALLVAPSAAELTETRDLLAARYAEAPEMGAVVEVARPEELFPPLAPGLSALFVPGAARVDGRAVRDALLAEALRNGTALVRGTALLGDPLAVTTDRHTPPPGVPASARAGSSPAVAADDEVATTAVAEAEVVVVAAGAWSGEVCAGLGVDVEVLPRRGQIVHAVLPGADAEGWPIVLPRRGPYLLGFPDGRIVAGATVEDVGFDPRVTVGGVREILSAAVELAPGLARASLAETRVGLRPVRPDGRALISRLGERHIVATGLGAYGLTAGAFAGRLAAELALGEPPVIDVSPYGI